MAVLVTQVDPFLLPAWFSAAFLTEKAPQVAVASPVSLKPIRGSSRHHRALIRAACPPPGLERSRSIL